VYPRLSLLIRYTVNSKNDRETETYRAVDFIECDSEPISRFSFALTPPASAIVRTLNTAHETDGISTSYPTSAFITHLVYLHDTEVAVDVQKITVCEGSGGTSYPNH